MRNTAGSQKAPSSEEWKKDYEKAKGLLLDMEQLHLKSSISAQHGLQMRLISKKLEQLLEKLEGDSTIPESSSGYITQLRSRFDGFSENSIGRIDTSHERLEKVGDGDDDYVDDYETQMTSQDQQLEELLTRVSKTKQMSGAIYNELEQQNKLLDHTLETIDSTKSVMSTLTKQTKRIVRK